MNGTEIRDNGDITKLLMGKEVTVISKEWGEKRELTQRRGRIVGLELGISLSIFFRGELVSLLFFAVQKKVLYG